MHAFSEGSYEEAFEAHMGDGSTSLPGKFIQVQVSGNQGSQPNFGQGWWVAIMTQPESLPNPSPALEW